MRGFPKCINSKQDMENLLALPEYADQARTKLQEMKDARLVWVTGEKLANGDPGLTGPYHRVAEEVVAGKVEHYQQERREDPMSSYVRLNLKSIPMEIEP